MGVFSMKCWDCNGTGKDYNWLPVERCKTCHGTGYINMTNEEHLNLLNLQGKSEALAAVADSIGDIRDVEAWKEWLGAKYEE